MDYSIIAMILECLNYFLLPHLFPLSTSLLKPKPTTVVYLLSFLSLGPPTEIIISGLFIHSTVGNKLTSANPSQMGSTGLQYIYYNNFSLV